MPVWEREREREIHNPEAQKVCSRGQKSKKKYPKVIPRFARRGPEVRPSPSKRNVFGTTNALSKDIPRVHQCKNIPGTRALALAKNVNKKRREAQREEEEEKKENE